jgi:hypothetical protein
MKNNLTSRDLDNLISEKLDNCEYYSNICELIQTPVGRQRVEKRIKEIIEQDGITSISAALAQIESELRFE